ncbi:PREDICTED: interferon alpha-21-like [Thamnophis sirtalis]|uniref:Interferon alpha-21-like n=1 Tax=Thamnophis sirtalis TaxID=35019 RepID=A0A6I9XRC5_9SAUR|nr:PREDICTED: interferon alpha-21-like [Thamnophis sirtalis]
MISGCFQYIVLLLLLSSGIRSLNCNHIVKCQKDETMNTIKLLESMGPKMIPWQCFNQIQDFAFPIGNDTGSIKEDARATVGLMLEQINRIFSQNFTKAEWNMTITEHFQISLDQQLVQWEKCSVAETGKKATFKDVRTKLKLRKYFLRLDRFLKDEEYSSCAWEAVRHEIMGIQFVFLDQLLRTLQH